MFKRTTYTIRIWIPDSSGMTKVFSPSEKWD